MGQWSITSADVAIETNTPGFESEENQPQSDVRVVPIALFV